MDYGLGNHGPMGPGLAGNPKAIGFPPEEAVRDAWLFFKAVASLFSLLAEPETVMRFFMASARRLF
jgi:hypothetical protein